MGMLGNVDGYITYTLTPKSWKVKMTANGPDTHKTRTPHTTFLSSLLLDY